MILKSSLEQIVIRRTGKKDLQIRKMANDTTDSLNVKRKLVLLKLGVDKFTHNLNCFGKIWGQGPNCIIVNELSSLGQLNF